MDTRPKPAILLVEDNADDVIMIRASLKKAFIDNPLCVVPDGEQAIAYLVGTGHYANRYVYPLPHVMLLDLRMPRMDGFAVLRWVRQGSPFARLPIIVLTDSQSVHDLATAYVLGADSFLRKPGDFQSVVGLMRGFAAQWLPTGTPSADGAFSQHSQASLTKQLEQ